MNNSLKRWLFALLFLGCLAGCNDEEPQPAPDPRTEREILLAGDESKSWVLSKVTLNEEDVTSFYLNACSRDNPYVLYRNGEAEIHSGTNKCEENESEVLEKGDWELSEDLSKLTLNLNSLSRTFTIQDVSEETLEIVLEEQGQDYVLTYKEAD